MIAGHLFRDGSDLSLAIDCTESALERMKGLLGKDEPRSGWGLWIKPCNSVHTFFMRYGLDVVYLDRHGRVLKTVAHLTPWRLSLCLRAHSVVELKQGSVEQFGIKKGDQWTWRE